MGDDIGDLSRGLYWGKLGVWTMAMAPRVLGSNLGL